VWSGITFCIEERFHLPGVYVSVSITLCLFVWKLRHVVSIFVLQAVTCLRRVKLNVMQSNDTVVV
jgi:hypothetical protein